MSWRDNLIKRVPGTIRRFHVTSTEKLPSIASQGLLPLDPETVGAPGAGRGVYTDVHPDIYFHEMPGEALIAVDIPKDEYRRMPRLLHNPETPEYRYGMGLTARQASEQSDIDLWERYMIDTINDKGRVDVFTQDILKPEWFTDIIYTGPDLNIYRYRPNKSNSKMLNWQTLSDDLFPIDFKTTDELIGPSVNKRFFK